MRGRSEATSLARCRAQIEHRVRDGRAHPTWCSSLTLIACSKWATIVTPRAPHQCASSRALNELRVRDQDFPHATGPDRPDELALDPCATSAAQFARLCGHGGAITRTTDTGHRQPWRERPLRTRAGPFAARAPGSLTPWFPALIAASAPASGRQRAPPIVGSVARSRWNLRPVNRLSSGAGERFVARVVDA